MAESRRLQFQAILKAMLPEDKKVYYQPPTGTKMDYPCIVYKLDDEQSTFADNAPYRIKPRYQVIVIDADPDTLIRDKVKVLPESRFDRAIVNDNLNHFYYNVYF